MLQQHSRIYVIFIVFKMVVVNFTYLSGDFDSFSVPSKSGLFKTTEDELYNSETTDGCLRKYVKDVCVLILIRAGLIVEQHVKSYIHKSIQFTTPGVRRITDRTLIKTFECVTCVIGYHKIYIYLVILPNFLHKL